MLASPPDVAPTSRAAAREGVGVVPSALGTLGALLVLGLVALRVAAAFRAPLGYDEAYNLQIVTNVLAGRGYATDGLVHDGRLLAFDHWITTGPTLMLPVVAVASVLGEHLWALRLVPVAGFLALLGGWALLGHRVAGRRGALAAAAGVLLVDTASATWSTSPLLGPGDVLGELTGTALLVLAALLLRRPALAGTALGLAVMAKTLLLLPALPLLLAVLLGSPATGRTRRAVALRAAAGLGLPVLAWQVVRLLALGPAEAVARDLDFARFVVWGGSGLADAPSAGVVERLSHQVALVGGRAGLAAILLVVAALAALVLRQGAAVLRAASGPLLPVVALGAGGLGIETWWLLGSDRDLVRHSVPAALLLVPAVLVAGARLTRSVPPRSSVRGSAARVVVGLAAVCVVASLALRLGVDGPASPDQRREQLQMAAWLDQRPGGFVVTGWDQAPELVLLSSAPVRRLGPEGGLLVISRHVGVGVANPAFAETRERCDRVLLDRGNYLACEVRAAASTSRR